ncbi:tubulin-tyrosine ligase/Tubulin polyglutamylase, partial [Cladochytrium replicatum]
LRQCGFKLVRGGRRWVGYWGKHCAAERFKHIRPWQKVNHFPTSFEIGRKDKLAWNLKRLRERVGDEGAMDLDFLPETFTLPRARRKLRAVFQSHPVWIVKPPANARGNGIKLINKWSDAPKKKEAVISRYGNRNLAFYALSEYSLFITRYIQNPLLIDHRKFDLRVYVLVTSFEPLRVYIYKEGIARFACDCYPVQLNSKTIKNRFAHLTNFSVARKKNKGEPTKQLGQEKAATKRRRSRRNLEIPVDDDRFSMESCKWLLRSSCYELFGFDILLDEHLKPWLMEVNISPSLKASCPVDENIKARLVRDIFNLV